MQATNSRPDGSHRHHSRSGFDLHQILSQEHYGPSNIGPTIFIRSARRWCPATTPKRGDIDESKRGSQHDSRQCATYCPCTDLNPVVREIQVGCRLQLHLRCSPHTLVIGMFTFLVGEHPRPHGGSISAVAKVHCPLSAISLQPMSSRCLHKLRPLKLGIKRAKLCLHARLVLYLRYLSQQHKASVKKRQNDVRTSYLKEH